ncbi:hypothetical protein [Streptococcus hyovaginalis]
MKKIVTLATVALAGFSLAACSSDKNTDNLAKIQDKGKMVGFCCKVLNKE